MDSLTSLKVFRQVVQQGSFTRAAEALQLSVAMVSKNVSHLERQIQTRLLHRTSRRLSLTEAGQLYFDDISIALELLEQAAASASLGVQQPQGTLKLTAPNWCATAGFANWLAEYQQQYPEVTIELHLDNRRFDLVAEGFDLALRVTGDPHPSLIVKPLAPIRLLLVASPAYLARHGTPQHPNDLARHHGIAPTYTSLHGMPMWRNGHSHRFELPTVFASSDAMLSYQLARAGAGIAYLSEWLVTEDLAEGRLHHILPDYTTPATTLYAAYVNRQFLSAKVRSFIDFLADKLNDTTPPDGHAAT